MDENFKKVQLELSYAYEEHNIREHILQLKAALQYAKNVKLPDWKIRDIEAKLIEDDIKLENLKVNKALDLI